MKKWTFVLLTIIVLFGAILRFLWLDLIPSGVTPDEIIKGYSAFSILKTGKDEWGDIMPISPRTYGDYQPPLYMYLTVPAVALFGLNIFATRFPAALIGVLTIVVIFFLTKELFKKTEIALIASFILAISTWHVFYSRVAWESNMGSFFFLLGLLLYLKSRQKMWFLVLSAISFGLSLFTYFPFKVFVPLFLVSLVLIDYKGILKIPRNWLLGSVGIFLLFVVVMAWGNIFSGASRRALDTAIFNSENIEILRKTQLEDSLPQPWGRVINNRLAFLEGQFIQNYLGYFSTTFWVSPNRSDSSLFNLPGQWLISFWQFIAILFGIYYLARNRTKEGLIIASWAFLAPIPAALTRDYMHAQRVQILLQLASPLAALGIYYLYKSLSNKRVQKLFILGLGIIIFINFFQRADFYVFHQFKRDLGGVHYGYDEITAYTQKNYNKYDTIIFTKQQGEPQAFVAFYSQMDPQFYQSYSKDWKDFENKGFKFLDMTNYHLGKYYFTNIDWNKIKKTPNALVIATDAELPDDIKPIYEVKDPFGKSLFMAVETNTYADNKTKI